MATDMKLPVSILRILTVILAIITVGLGCYSHFESVWVEKVFIPGMGNIKFHEGMCLAAKLERVPCPSISMELYFVSMVIICAILSILLLVASFLIDLSGQPFKLVDMGIHAIAALLLLIAAIVYIVSAEQIYNLVRGPPLRRGEKLAAGGLAIVQSLLYGVMAFLVGRQSQQKE